MIPFACFSIETRPSKNSYVGHCEIYERCFLEAQVLPNYIDVTDSLRHSLIGCLAISIIYVVCRSIWTFFTVLPPRSHLSPVEE